MPLFPKTTITVTEPLPTTAVGSMTPDGKLRLEFEIDLAAVVGRAVLAGTKPEVMKPIGDSMAEAVKRLFEAMAAGVQLSSVVPKGEA